MSTIKPTARPTNVLSSNTSNRPTLNVTLKPTSKISSSNPTWRPSSIPTKVPTIRPSLRPTQKPTDSIIIGAVKPSSSTDKEKVVAAVLGTLGGILCILLVTIYLCFPNYLKKIWSKHKSIKYNHITTNQLNDDVPVTVTESIEDDTDSNIKGFKSNRQSMTQSKQLYDNNVYYDTTSNPIHETTTITTTNTQYVPTKNSYQPILNNNINVDDQNDTINTININVKDDHSTQNHDHVINIQENSISHNSSTSSSSEPTEIIQYKPFTNEKNTTKFHTTSKFDSTHVHVANTVISPTTSNTVGNSGSISSTSRNTNENIQITNIIPQSPYFDKSISQSSTRSSTSNSTNVKHCTVNTTHLSTNSSMGSSKLNSDTNKIVTIQSQYSTTTVGRTLPEQEDEFDRLVQYPFHEEDPIQISLAVHPVHVHPNDIISSNSSDESVIEVSNNQHNDIKDTNTTNIHIDNNTSKDNPIEISNEIIITSESDSESTHIAYVPSSRVQFSQLPSSSSSGKENSTCTSSKSSYFFDSFTTTHTSVTSFIGGVGGSGSEDSLDRNDAVIHALTSASIDIDMESTLRDDSMEEYIDNNIDTEVIHYTLLKPSSNHINNDTTTSATSSMITHTINIDHTGNIHIDQRKKNDNKEDDDVSNNICISNQMIESGTTSDDNYVKIDMKMSDETDINATKIIQMNTQDLAKSYYRQPVDLLPIPTRVPSLLTGNAPHETTQNDMNETSIVLHSEYDDNKPNQSQSQSDTTKTLVLTTKTMYQDDIVLIPTITHDSSQKESNVIIELTDDYDKKIYDKIQLHKEKFQLDDTEKRDESNITTTSGLLASSTPRSEESVHHPNSGVGSSSNSSAASSRSSSRLRPGATDSLTLSQAILQHNTTILNVSRIPALRRTTPIPDSARSHIDGTSNTLPSDTESILQSQQDILTAQSTEFITKSKGITPLPEVRHISPTHSIRHTTYVSRIPVSGRKYAYISNKESKTDTSTGDRNIDGNDNNNDNTYNHNESVDSDILTTRSEDRDYFHRKSFERKISPTTKKSMYPRQTTNDSNLSAIRRRVKSEATNTDSMLHHNDSNYDNKHYDDSEEYPLHNIHIPQIITHSHSSSTLSPLDHRDDTTTTNMVISPISTARQDDHPTTSSKKHTTHPRSSIQRSRMKYKAYENDTHSTKSLSHIQEDNNDDDHYSYNHSQRNQEGHITSTRISGITHRSSNIASTTTRINGPGWNTSTRVTVIKPLSYSSIMQQNAKTGNNSSSSNNKSHHLHTGSTDMSAGYDIDEQSSIASTGTISSTNSLTSPYKKRVSQRKSIIEINEYERVRWPENLQGDKKEHKPLAEPRPIFPLSMIKSKMNSTTTTTTSTTPVVITSENSNSNSPRSPLNDSTISTEEIQESTTVNHTKDSDQNDDGT